MCKFRIEYYKNKNVPYISDLNQQRCLNYANLIFHTLQLPVNFM